MQTTWSEMFDSESINYKTGWQSNTSDYLRLQFYSNENNANQSFTIFNQQDATTNSVSQLGFQVYLKTYK